VLIQGKVEGIKKRQAPFIAPLQPSAFAAFRPWRIGQELVVKDLPFASKNTQVSTFRRRIFTEIPQNNFSGGLLLTSADRDTL